MAKTMVVRAGIEVYRQKFLGAISLERNWIMSGIFLQRKLKIDGKQFLTGPVIRAEILTNLLLIL
jgi:hypothetical protein